VTLTSDLGKILSALHSVKIAGAGDFMTGIQIAQVQHCSRISIVFATECGDAKYNFKCSWH
jgi:hypothetical protein